MYGRSDAACTFGGSHEHCMQDVSSAMESHHHRVLRFGSGPGHDLEHTTILTGHGHGLIRTCRIPSSIARREQVQ